MKLASLYIPRLTVWETLLASDFVFIFVCMHAFICVICVDLHVEVQVPVPQCMCSTQSTVWVPALAFYLDRVFLFFCCLSLCQASWPVTVQGRLSLHLSPHHIGSQGYGHTVPCLPFTRGVWGFKLSGHLSTKPSSQLTDDLMERFYFIFIKLWPNRKCAWESQEISCEIK